MKRGPYFLPFVILHFDLKLQIYLLLFQQPTVGRVDVQVLWLALVSGLSVLFTKQVVVMFNDLYK